MAQKLRFSIDRFNMDFSSPFSWQDVRQQFRLSEEYIHLGASQYFSSHPLPVRRAIKYWRKLLDANPVLCVEENEYDRMEEVRQAIAFYMDAKAEDIAVTDSATMGLGLLYNGLHINEGQHILTTEHNHYSHHEAIRLAADRKKASVKKIKMYEALSTVSADEMVSAIRNNITENTRVLGLTWVHSGTGLKIPAAEIGKLVRELNATRDDSNRIIFVLDGVHGFGVETETIKELGCDFFISSCHKWIYGPRGSGFVCAAENMWPFALPVIPDFSEVMLAEVKGIDRPEKMNGRQATPGGFHTLEHRWAVKDAFEFHAHIGRQRIKERVYELNQQLKKAMSEMQHVTLHTPVNQDLSCGIICFDVKDFTTTETVEYFKWEKIIATEAPYLPTSTRFTPGIYNTPEEIEKTISVLQNMKKA